MSSRRRHLWVLAALLLVASTTRAEPPPAQDSDAVCTAAYTGGQRLRNKGKLRAAKEQLAICARPACSPVLRGDCTQWLTEVQALMPSVVIAARGPSGDDVVAVRVLMDGVPLADKLSGVALEVDPGPHRLRFEMDGAQLLEKELVLREGEKARRVDVNFTAATGGIGKTTQAETPAEHKPETEPSAHQGPRRSTLVLVYVLGGVGLVALGTGVFLEIDGLNKRSSLDACKPTCNPDDVSAARTTTLGGDIAIGVGLAALTAGALLYFMRAPASASASTHVRFEVAPAGRGAFAGLRGAF